jgi:hypothetical protein
MVAQFEWEKAASAVPELIDLFLKRYKTGRGVHAETVIGAAAALTGAAALQATTPMAPGRQYALSTAADQILFDEKPLGKSLTDVVLDLADKAGLRPDQHPDIIDVRRRVVEAFGSKSFPPLSIPVRHYPQEWSPNATVRFRGWLERFFARKGLTPLEAAAALACTTGALIQMTKDALEPCIAVLLAMEIMIGVSRMRPLDREI